MRFTPKSPKGWLKHAISLFVPVKFNFSQKSLLQSFFVLKLSAAYCSYIIPYPTVHRSIAGDVPIYPKLAFKVMHPFRKRRYPKLLLPDVNSRSRSLYAIADPSVCRLSFVTLVRPTHPVEIFGIFFHHTIAQVL